MKKSILAFLTALSAQLLYSQCIIQGPQQACIGQSATYSADSIISGYDYQWSIYGDGTLVTSQTEAIVSWGDTGQASIVLIVFNSYNQVVCTVTQVVQIFDFPKPSIQASISSACDKDRKTDKDPPCSTACDSQWVEYSTPFHTGSSYAWTVTGPADTQSNGNVLRVYWTGLGNFSVQVTETNNAGCQGFATFCVNVIESPDAAFTTLPIPGSVSTVACLGQSVQFIDASTDDGDSPLSHVQWFFGDGSTELKPYTSNTNTSHEYSSSGIFQVMQIVYNACGCSDTAYGQVEISSLPGPDIICLSTVCPGTVQEYTTQADCQNLSWAATGGQIQGSYTTSQVSVQWSPTGPYFLSLTADCPNFCPVSSYVAVPVIPSSAPITGNGDLCQYQCEDFYLDCAIPVHEIIWHVPAGFTIVGDTINTHHIRICGGSADASGTLWATYNYSPNGQIPNAQCQGISTLPITVRSPFTIQSNNTRFCGSNDTLIAWISPNSNGLFTWVIRDESGLVLEQTTLAGSQPLVTPLNYPPGEYSLSAYDSSNQFCGQWKRVSIAIETPPDSVLGIQGPLQICPGSTQTYTAISNEPDLIIKWQIQGGTPSVSVGNSIAVTWNATGPYSLVLTHVDPITNCQSPSITIPVSSLLPVAAGSIQGPGIVCPNTNSVPFASTSPASAYNWNISPEIAGSVINGNPGPSIETQWNNYTGPAWVLVQREVCGQTRTDSLYISIQGPPNPQMSSPPLLCSGTAANFSSPTSAVNYEWNFGDGFTASGSAPSHSYSSPGNYPVTLTVTYGGFCSDTASVTNMVMVYPSPNINISTPDPTEYCSNPILTTMSISSPVIGASYTWNPTGTSGNSLTTTSTGTYYVTSTNSYGCTGQSNSISVSLVTCTKCAPEPYKLNFNRQSLNCNTDTFAGVASPNVTGLTWFFDDPFNLAGGTGLNASHYFPEPGYYRVKLCGMVPNTSGTGSCEVCVKKIDTIRYVPDFFDSLACQNNQNTWNVTFINTTKKLNTVPTPSYSWAVSPGGYTSTNTNASFTLSPGTYTVELTLAGGLCSKVKTIVIPALPASSFVALDSVCEGSPIPFQNNSLGPNLSFAWNFGDGASSLLTNPIREYANAGIYQVQLSVTSSLGCSDSSSTWVRVLPNTMQITTTGSGSICSGDSLQLSATVSGFYGSSSGIWSNGQTNNFQWVQMAGDYTFTAIDDKGCTMVSEPETVVVKNTPNAQIQGVTTLCMGSTYSYSVYYPNNLPGSNITWYLDGSLQNQGSNSISYFASSLGNHELVAAISSPDGCTDTDTLLFTIVSIPQVTVTNLASLCEGDGSLFVASYSGQQPLSGHWDNGSTNDSLWSWQSGTYTYTITDGNGCTNSSAGTVIPKPDLCGLNTGCYTYCDTVDPLIWYAPSGYNAYKWFFNGNLLPWAQSDSLHMLLYESGSYQVVVSNQQGCQSQSDPIDIQFTTCNSPCTFLTALDIDCGPVQANGFNSYHVTATVTNTIDTGASFQVSSGSGVVSNLIPSVLTLGTQQIEFDFAPWSTADSACFDFSIGTFKKFTTLPNSQNSVVCDTSLCIALPNCETSDCKAEYSISSIECVGHNAYGQAQYYICANVGWGGSFPATLSLLSNTGTCLPNPISINTAQSTQCFLYTHVATGNSANFITSVFDPNTQLNCKDTFKIKLPKCNDSCGFAIYNVCPHCKGNANGGWLYDIDVVVNNPFANNANVAIMPVAAGNISGISPLNIGMGTQTLSFEFTDVYPTNPTVCFKVVLTDEVTNQICFQTVCVALPNCDKLGSNLSIDYQTDISLYPNPTQENAQLEIRRVQTGEEMAYRITDMSGRLIQRWESQEMSAENRIICQIPSQNFVPGVYIVTLYQGGLPVGSIKLIKSN